jgi:hypothetical protein
MLLACGGEDETNQSGKSERGNKTRRCRHVQAVLMHFQYISAGCRANQVRWIATCCVCETLEVRWEVAAENSRKM